MSLFLEVVTGIGTRILRRAELQLLRRQSHQTAGAKGPTPELTDYPNVHLSDTPVMQARLVAD